MQTLNEAFLESLFDFLPAIFAGGLFLIFFVCFIAAIDCLARGHTRRHFSEPDSDAQIECDAVFHADERGPELLEIDTLGDPTPPSEIAVHRYKWMPALGAYEYLGQLPLSQYLLTKDDDEIEQVLSRGQEPPVTWDHKVIYPDRTNHGAPLDCALGASHLPR